jgi:hypothetical protein
VTAVCLALAFLATPGAADGKGTSKYSQPGPAGEIIGLKDVVVQRETLTFDLRPLAEASEARMEVVYQFTHLGPENTFDLIIVNNCFQDRGLVLKLDGQDVPCVRVDNPNLGPSWRPPMMTPGIDTDPLAFPYASQRGWKGRVKLTLGEHRLEARYAAGAASHRGESPIRYWQLAYVLAPARERMNLAQLDVTVRLPEGWRHASDPDLKRQGDTLQGTFNQVPADFLAFTVQAPEPEEYARAGRLGRALMTATLIGGPLVCLLVGGLFGLWLGRRCRTSWWAMLPAFGLGVLWTAALLVVSHRITVGQANLIPPGQRGSGVAPGVAFLVLVVLSLLALPGGLLLTQLTALVSRILSAPPVVRPAARPARWG